LAGEYLRTSILVVHGKKGKEGEGEWEAGLSLFLRKNNSNLEP